MTRWIWVLLSLAAVAATAAWMRFGAASDPTRAVMRLAPDLDPAMARHVALDDDDAFRRHAREAGPALLKKAMFQIEAGIDTTSLAAYSQGWDAALPHLLRIAGEIDRGFHCPGYLRDYRFRAGLAPESRWRLQRLIGARSVVGGDGTMPTLRKLAACDDFVARFGSFGYARGIMHTETMAANEVMELGRLDLRGAHLRRALELARSLGETYIACQVLGELGAFFETSGIPDSMAICYDEALALARRCQFGDQVARILSFYARNHASEGRLGVATQLMLEAQRASNELGGEGSEVRFLTGAVDFFAELGCWEISERLLQRAPALLRGHRAELALPTSRLALEQQRARVLLAKGRIDDAERLVRRIQDPIRKLPQRTLYAALAEQWSAGLVEAGRMADALPVVEEGLAYCDSMHVDEFTPALALRRAQVLYALGRLVPADDALRDFRRRARAFARRDPRLDIEANTLWARLREDIGQRAKARAALEGAFLQLRLVVLRMDCGPQGYLSLASFQNLRYAMHDILAPTPRAGYQAEREWRSLPSALGQWRSRVQTDAVPPRPWNAESVALRESTALPPAGTWHCVYLARPGAMVRWTATAGGVRRDTLTLTSQECARRIREVMESMAHVRDGGSAPDAELESGLRDLARQLLPPELFASTAAGATPTLYVTPDGPLGILPFEALNLALSGYEPLARRFDVAHVREAGDGGARRATGPPSILADPLTSREFRRRFPRADSLPAGELEAEAVREAWPEARVFRGADATKSAVLDSWSRAPRIHVAAHLVRDPEIPFIAFIPMATPPDSASRPAAYLELADVRALDLSGCELAILSGCASGAPYLSARRLGPSMGDGFLDAGAHAVVQTFWEIEDQDARRFVAAFLRDLSTGDHDPVRALNAARREVLGSSGSTPLPQEWATWSIALRSLPAQASTPRLASHRASMRPKTKTGM